MTAAYVRAFLALVLVLAFAAITVGAAGATQSSTRYKVVSAVGSETVTASGKITTLAGAPASYNVTFVMTWKAAGAGQYGTTSLSKTPPAGQHRLCESACPTIGPLAGKVVITGSVRPTDGKTPKISCAATKKLSQIYAKGATGNYRSVEFYEQGGKAMASIDAGQIDYLMQESVKEPTCKFYGAASTGYVQRAISPAVIGSPRISLSLADSKKVALQTPAGASGTVTHRITVTLVRY